MQDIFGCWEEERGSSDPRDLKELAEIKMKTRMSCYLGKWFT